MATDSKTTAQGAPKNPSDRSRKHLIAFAVMMVLTAIAFAAVATGALPVAALVTLLLIMAAIQVVIQFFTFMHLDQKGHFFPIFFTGAGLLFAVVVVLGVWLLL
ncbi:cytochrome c oxidase subunit 4 [Planifilum fimeticola]|uniref:Cytochrome c oxidase subunit 4 n=1 Tax=Planifilum fimeticola TaxID=201975 RepID=A0A2T0LE69_9BACL|nr:cytochrome C oxidase subunit IV family protein [Planifilum fimeticola]PRX40179.1 cytochrome c oxidase subunit 4 [Planifilum fimeticola]